MPAVYTGVAEVRNGDGRFRKVNSVGIGRLDGHDVS
jgi:hypothetical protein